MAVDAKTTTGGIVLLILSGSGSYLATNAIKGNENTSLLLEQRTSSSPTPDYAGVMKEKMTSDKLGELENEDAECTAALNKPFNSTNYKAAVKACYKGLTLEKRAQQLDVSLLVTTSASDTTTLKTRFDSLSASNPHKMAQLSAAKMDWITSNNDDNTNVTNLKTFCEKVKVLTLQQISANESKLSLEDEWVNFLKMCAQDASLNKSFWIVEATN